MKKLLLLVPIILLANSCQFGPPKGGYTVNYQGVSEHTNDIKNVGDGCVGFNNKVVCGTYSIDSN